jgi:hypothetical protein
MPQFNNGWGGLIRHTGHTAGCGGVAACGPFALCEAFDAGTVRCLGRLLARSSGEMP